MIKKKTSKPKSRKKSAVPSHTPALVGSREELRKLKEIPFCKQVLVPLFEAMKYRDVRFTGGGPLEQGKDITMWEANSLDQRINIAVVAKAGNITGSVASAGEVVTQIQQCLGSTFFENASSAPQTVHRCFVVTNGDITKEGRVAILTAVKGASISDDRVTLMDLGDVWTLLQKHRSHIALLGTMKEAYDTLNSTDPDYAIELEFTVDGVRQAIVAKRKDALPMKVSLVATFPADEGGKSKLAEFQQFMESGGSFTLNAEYVGKLDLPPLMEALSPQNAGVELSFIPSKDKRIRASVTAVSPEGERAEIPFVDFRSVVNAAGQLQLINDQQNGPYRFTVTFEEPKRAVIEFLFEFARGTFVQVLRALRFQDAFARGGSIVLRDLEDETANRSSVPEGLVDRPHPRLIQLVQMVVDIEKRFQTRFSVPGRLFSAEQAKMIALLHQIVTTGRIVSPMDATVEIDARDARKLMTLIEGDLLLVTNGTPTPLALFGQRLDLGEARVRIPAAKVHPADAARILNMTEDALSHPIKLRLIAGGTQPIVTEYSKWLASPEPTSQSGGDLAG
jgi:hypothetical protein